MPSYIRWAVSVHKLAMKYMSDSSESWIVPYAACRSLFLTVWLDPHWQYLQFLRGLFGVYSSPFQALSIVRHNLGAVPWLPHADTLFLIH